MAVFQVNSGWTVAPLALPLPVFISYNRTFEVISTGYTPSSRVLYEDNKLTNFSTVIGPNSLLMVDYGILTVAGWQCANIKLQLLQRLATYSCTSTARLAFCNQNLLGDNSGYYQSDARWAVDEATVRQTASITVVNFDGRTAATVLNDLGYFLPEQHRKNVMVQNMSVCILHMATSIQGISFCLHIT